MVRGRIISLRFMSTCTFLLYLPSADLLVLKSLTTLRRRPYSLREFLLFIFAHVEHGSPSIVCCCEYFTTVFFAWQTRLNLGLNYSSVSAVINQTEG